MDHHRAGELIEEKTITFVASHLHGIHSLIQLPSDNMEDTYTLKTSSEGTWQALYISDKYCSFPRKKA